MIGVQDAKIIRLGHIYYLTKKGRQFLMNEISSDDHTFNFVKKKPSLDSNIFHRTYAIDCQIELSISTQEKGETILFYHKDVDNSPGNLERKTRISLSPNNQIEPDAIFMLDTIKGRKLYCLEFEYRDSFSKSFAKAKKYIQATNKKSVSKRFNHPKGHRTLFIYHDEKMMTRIMDKLVKEANGLNNWFLFKTYDEVLSPLRLIKSQFNFTQKKNFFEGWRTVNRDVIQLY